MGLARYTRKTFAREITLLVLAAIWWVPFYFLVIVSLKPTDEIFAKPLTSFPERFEFGNYQSAWDEGSLGRALLNSFVITGGTVLALIALGSVCAYAIARRPGRLGAGLYVLFVLGIILPFQLGLVPTYVVLRELGLVGSYLGIILLYTGIWMPMSVFLYTGF